MDDLRAYLEKGGSQNQGFPTIGGTINFLSQASFGDQAGINGQGGQQVRISDGTSTSGQPSFDMELFRALAARGFAAAYRSFIRTVGSVLPRRPRKTSGPWGYFSSGEEEANWPAVDEAVFKQFEPLMAGVLTKRSLSRAAAKYPALLSMDPKELGIRLVRLKALLYGCDVAFLVEEEPQLYVGGEREEVEKRIQQGMDLLRKWLAGADINAVVMRDPQLIFLPGLLTGLQQLRDLWDVDEQALADSDPMELALAVRALSNVGPPAVM